MRSNLQRAEEPENGPAAIPGDAGTEGNICGVLVHVRPEKMEESLKLLAELPGTEIHQSASDGRVVVTVEDVPGKWAGNTLTDISNLEGVLSAALVFHHRDEMADGEEEGSDDEEVTQ